MSYPPYDVSMSYRLFLQGVLVESLRKGYWIILDELNLAPSEVRGFLLPLLVEQSLRRTRSSIFWIAVTCGNPWKH